MVWPKVAYLFWFPQKQLEKSPAPLKKHLMLSLQKQLEMSPYICRLLACLATLLACKNAGNQCTSTS